MLSRLSPRDSECEKSDELSNLRVLLAMSRQESARWQRAAIDLDAQCAAKDAMCVEALCAEAERQTDTPRDANKTRAALCAARRGLRDVKLELARAREAKGKLMAERDESRSKHAAAARAAVCCEQASQAALAQLRERLAAAAEVERRQESSVRLLEDAASRLRAHLATLTAAYPPARSEHEAAKLALGAIGSELDCMWCEKLMLEKELCAAHYRSADEAEAASPSDVARVLAARVPVARSGSGRSGRLELAVHTPLFTPPPPLFRATIGDDSTASASDGPLVLAARSPEPSPARAHVSVSSDDDEDQAELVLLATQPHARFTRFSSLADHHPAEAEAAAAAAAAVEAAAEGRRRRRRPSLSEERHCSDDEAEDRDDDTRMPQQPPSLEEEEEKEEHPQQPQSSPQSSPQLSPQRASLVVRLLETPEARTVLRGSADSPPEPSPERILPTWWPSWKYGNWENNLSDSHCREAANAPTATARPACAAEDETPARPATAPATTTAQQQVVNEVRSIMCAGGNSRPLTPAGLRSVRATAPARRQQRPHSASPRAAQFKTVAASPAAPRQRTLELFAGTSTTQRARAPAPLLRCDLRFDAPAHNAALRTSPPQRHSHNDFRAVVQARASPTPRIAPRPPSATFSAARALCVPTPAALDRASFTPIASAGAWERPRPR